jgi:hypothetical protein
MQQRDKQCQQFLEAVLEIFNLKQTEITADVSIQGAVTTYTISYQDIELATLTELKMYPSCKFKYTTKINLTKQLDEKIMSYSLDTIKKWYDTVENKKVIADFQSAMLKLTEDQLSTCTEYMNQIIKNSIIDERSKLFIKLLQAELLQYQCLSDIKFNNTHTGAYTVVFKNTNYLNRHIGDFLLANDKDFETQLNAVVKDEALQIVRTLLKTALS